MKKNVVIAVIAGVLSLLTTVATVAQTVSVTQTRKLSLAEINGTVPLDTTKKLFLLTKTYEVFVRISRPADQDTLVSDSVWVGKPKVNAYEVKINKSSAGSMIYEVSDLRERFSIAPGTTELYALKGDEVYNFVSSGKFTHDTSPLIKDLKLDEAHKPLSAVMVFNSTELSFQQE